MKSITGRSGRYLRSFFAGFCGVLALAACSAGPARDLPPNAVVPSLEQIEYQKMEFIGFVHFTVNTFTDREWGLGDESPDVFHPTDFDPDQWAAAAAEAGMKELILTVKHHDGFCLWPSRHTGHSVRAGSWREGRGDVVGEFAAACRRHGLKVGLYLSPWDRNHADYGRAAYLDYYRAQLRELLTEYGPITELWFDGANGGTGYYGGARGERRIDRTTYYRWPETWALVKSLHPGILIFSDAGPDIRWIGNEGAIASETNWSTITTEGIVVGGADNRLLHTGDPEGSRWTVPLCNTSIRPGWFYHESEDEKVKSSRELVDIYYKSVGRNGVLLLNVPPDRRGRFHDFDVAALRGFRRILDETFAVDLAAGAGVMAAGGSRRGFPASNLVDSDPDSAWAAAGTGKTADLEVNLGKRVRFDRILLQEPIRYGQRISRFSIQARGAGEWETVATGTTIGYKRLLRIPEVETDRVRILIQDALNIPALSRLGLFKASPDEEDGGRPPSSGQG